MHKPSHEMREGRGGETRAGSSLRRGGGSGRGYAVSLRWGEEVRGHFCLLPCLCECRRRLRVPRAGGQAEKGPRIERETPRPTC